MILLYMNLTQEQLNALKIIGRFIKSNDKIFILKGHAGTGKSTIITQLLQNVFFQKQKIALCATTNKAVSVLETLFPKSRNVTFMTIHKLLRIKRIIDLEGKIQYVSPIDNSDWTPSSNNKSIYDYDIIIVDEASMVSRSLTDQILSVSSKIKGKIIFVGDIAQLPPINEEYSKIFKLNLPSCKLKTVMRSNNNITLLSQEVRKLIYNRQYKLQIRKYEDNGVSLYKNLSIWLNSYLDDYRNNKKPIILVYTNKQRDCLNQQIRTSLFNNVTDKYVPNELIVFNQYYKFPGSDISYYNSQQAIITNITDDYITINSLNFNNILNLKMSLTPDSNSIESLVPKVDVPNVMCPICLEEEVDFVRETPCHHYFCTGCIIMWLEKNKCCPYCRMEIVKDNNYIRIKNNASLTSRINTLMDKTINKTYKVWNITLNHSHEQIMVIHPDSEEKYQTDLKLIRDTLTDIKKYIDKNSLNKFTTTLLNRMWEFYYFNYLDQFADISYGYCITTHKSQGSTFNIVYVDLPNIIDKNLDNKQKYQCLYTAVTRPSHQLNLLLSK